MFFTNDLGMFSVYQKMSVMRFKLWENYQGHVIKEWQSSEPNPASLIQGQCSSIVKLPPQPSASLVAQGLGSLAFFLPLQPFLLFSPNGYSSSTFNSRPSPDPLVLYFSPEPLCFISMFFLGICIHPLSYFSHQLYVVDSPFPLQSYTYYREKLMNFGVREAWGEISELPCTTCETSLGSLEPLLIFKMRIIVTL